MPRNYQRVRSKKYTAEDLNRAVTAMKDGNSIYSVVKKEKMETANQVKPVLLLIDRLKSFDIHVCANRNVLPTTLFFFVCLQMRVMLYNHLTLVSSDLQNASGDSSSGTGFEMVA